MEGADGIVVSMPRTVLAVDLTVERTVTLCGPYARYAQKYLGVRAPLTDKTTWSVVGARIALSGDDLYDAGEPAAPQQRVLQHASSDEEFARVQPDKMSMVVPSLEDAARALPSRYSPCAATGWSSSRAMPARMSSVRG